MHGDDSPQMTLFPELAPPPDAAASLPRRLRVVRPWYVAVRVLLQLRQAPLRMPLRALERDEDTEWDFPAHRAVSAAEAPPVQTVAVSSIFGLADTLRQLKRGRFGAPEQFDPAPYRVERSHADGTVRVIRQRPDETAEWREKEAARRARQRPPKPTKKAKTRSKALLEMIGENRDDE
jgi:hypothetical protein